MGKVIVVTSGKGGVGKTTTVANLGAGLAQKGRRVAVVDADIGLRNLDVVLGLENRIVYDLMDVAEQSCTLKQALLRDQRFADLHLLAASQVRDKNALSPLQMREVTQALANEFDYVFVDCPAGIEQGFQCAVAAADEAIVVVTPELTAVRDADRIVGLLSATAIQEDNVRLLVNRVRPKMIAKGDMLSPAEVADALGLDIIGVVPEDERIILSANRGEAAVLRKRSVAGRAYRNICNRLEGYNVPFLRFERRAPHTLFGLRARAGQGNLRKERRA